MSDETPRQIRVGDEAPDFTLASHDGTEFTLGDQRGKKVLLSFHPLAWTGVCADQMRSLEGNQKRFGPMDTVAVGISVDPVPTKTAWAKELGVHKTPLLSDFWSHGEVARRYGLFLEDKGISGRANVIVDEEGKVIFVRVYPIPELPDIAEILELLEGRE